MEELPMDAPAVDAGRIAEWTAALRDYQAGLSRVKGRIVAAENWWLLRNTREEGKATSLGRDGGFTAASGWLHNVIVSKHADAMDAFPEPVILPREPGDTAEAEALSGILPCVLEQNQFERTYSDVMWQKMKFGTGVYKVVWDSRKLGGLGDIRVERVNLLDLYWEPGITDIQCSRLFFHLQRRSREELAREYPAQAPTLRDTAFLGTRFAGEELADPDKLTVAEVYYHAGGRLHYAKFVGSTLLYATENDPLLRDRGLYDHNLYPFVFDPLFPMEGSPCGYGYVDICRSPQTQIDLLQTSFVRNAMVGATPRFFARPDGKVNEGEFLDLNNPIVHVTGSLDEAALRQIGHTSLDGGYIQLLRDTVDELRQTSGNTETATGNISSGVTAASAIAALQEASGKGSRDSTLGSYRAYRQVVSLAIELIRQFYDAPRQFRILGQGGRAAFVSYDNRRLRPQAQGAGFGVDLGWRTPVFDIRVEAQKKNAYARLSQNELATQLFQLGVFNPARAAEALACLNMMDFEGKDRVIAAVAAGAMGAAAPAAGREEIRLTRPEGERMLAARAKASEAGVRG